MLAASAMLSTLMTALVLMTAALCGAPSVGN